MIILKAEDCAMMRVYMTVMILIMALMASVCLADETLVGEDIFALGSYLDCPAHLGSLMTEDVLRIITAGLILIGVVFYSLRF